MKEPNWRNAEGMLPMRVESPHDLFSKESRSLVRITFPYEKKSVPGRSRTCGLLIRNQPLSLLSYGDME